MTKIENTAKLNEWFIDGVAEHQPESSNDFSFRWNFLTDQSFKCWFCNILSTHQDAILNGSLFILLLRHFYIYMAGTQVRFAAPITARGRFLVGQKHSPKGASKGKATYWNWLDGHQKTRCMPGDPETLQPFQLSMNKKRAIGWRIWSIKKGKLVRF